MKNTKNKAKKAGKVENDMNMFFERMLHRHERDEMALRTLYEAHGYKNFKMNKFEEYDLYRENRSFLVGSNIITFSGLDGRLMALKPDVTLSIVKNVKEGEDLKLYYSENVYRAEKGAYEFGEIVQVGAEHIGTLDLYSMCEIISLAQKSLAVISEEYILDISHLGIIAELLEECGLSEKNQSLVLGYIAEKNTHDLGALLGKVGAAKELKDTLVGITKLCGRCGEVILKLEALLGKRCSASLAELKELCEKLEQIGCIENIRLDFSILSDMNYYNGIVFKGFIPDVPKSILSGGRYDKLLKKFEKKQQAAGFAVYLNLLEEYKPKLKEYDFDNLIVYSAGDDIKKVYDLSEELVKKGETVRVQMGEPNDITAKNKIVFSKEGDKK